MGIKKERGLALTTLKGYDTLTTNKNAHVPLARYQSMHERFTLFPVVFERS